MDDGCWRGMRICLWWRGERFFVVHFWVLFLFCCFAGIRCFCAGICAGIRDLLACFRRRPCAGRHLLFFAAAKKSRQKKAAHTASSSCCLRAPTGSYTSHGNHVIHARCQRSNVRLTRFTHPHYSIPRQIVHGRPGGKLCVGPRAPHALLRTDSTRVLPVRALTYTTRQPTHCLPPGRHIPFAAVCRCTGA